MSNSFIIFVICTLTLFILSDGQVMSFTSPPNLAPILDTCPCKKAPKSNQCITYDPRYAATTLDEVVLNFADTTVADAANAKNILGNEPAYKKGIQGLHNLCTTPDCLGCLNTISQKLINSINTAAASEDHSWSLDLNGTVADLNQKMKDKSKGYMTACKNLMNTKQPQKVNQTTTTTMPSMFPPHDSGFWNMVDSMKATKGESATTKGRRRKRQSSSTLIGTSTVLKCDFKRGDYTDSSQQYVGLCNFCWSVRTLPDKYFPRYLNERTCDTDTRCLSGYGTCREVNRNVDVMYNSGTDDVPKYDQVSINTVIACECQVRADSSMHSFVMN